MSLTFSRLQELREHQLPLATIVVLAFLEEGGPQPVGIVAQACKLSTRSVERALAALGRLGILPTKLSHDHDHGDHVKKGTATDLSDKAAATDKVDGDKPVDPLRARLLSYEVLAWCVDIIMARADRQTIERQLDYHAFRLAAGFRFSGHPAKYLFKACLNDYAVPEGFHKARQRHIEPQAVRAQPETQSEHLTQRQEALLYDLRTELQVALKRPKSPMVETVIRAVHRKAQEAGIPIAILTQEASASERAVS